MTWHTMVLSEADPHRQGFIRRYFATIDVVMSGSAWVWQQVDANGSYFGHASAPQPTEDLAKSDALQTLNGDEWE